MDRADVPGAAAEPQPLRLRTKLFFGIGSAAETIALFSLGSYALLYYNQVLGLPGWLGGLAISLSFVVDGFADPVIGSISDRTRSRFGRRHPFMYAAPMPIAGSAFSCTEKMSRPFRLTPVTALVSTTIGGIKPLTAPKRGPMDM